MNKKIMAVAFSSVLLLAACGEKNIAPSDPNSQQQPNVVTNTGDYVNPALSLGQSGGNSGNSAVAGEGSNGTFFSMGSDKISSFNTENTVDEKAGQDLNSLNLTPEQLALLKQMEEIQNSEGTVKQQKKGNNGLSTGLTDQVLSNYEDSSIMSGDSSGMGTGMASNTTGMNSQLGQNNSQMNSGSMTQTTQQLLQQKLNELSGSNGNYQVGAGYEKEESTEQYPESTLAHTLVNEVQAPAGIKEWMNNQKKQVGIFGKEEGSHYYILLSAGPKNESGFKVNLLGIYKGEGNKPAELHFNVTQNKTGRISMTSHPTLLVRVSKADVPNDLRFFGDISQVSE